MSIQDDIQKSINRQKAVIDNFFTGTPTPEFLKAIEEDIQKGKRAEIGEIRTYGGKKYQKVAANGNHKDWVIVKEDGGSISVAEKPEEKKGVSSSRSIVLDDSLHKISQAIEKEKKLHSVPRVGASSLDVLQSLIRYDGPDAQGKINKNSELKELYIKLAKKYGFGYKK